MCGIVFARVFDGSKKTAAQKVLKRYHKQKGRGSDGFGYVSIDAHNSPRDFARFMFQSDMERDLKRVSEPTVLFHHRYPTSAPNLQETAHPIKVSRPTFRYDYYVVHNGWINNAEALKEKHELLGYTYTTEIECWYYAKNGKRYEAGTEFNDSEALAIELARAFEGVSSEIDTDGPIAFCALQVERTTGRALALYYGTNNGNTLTLLRDQYSIMIASEGGTKIPDNTLFRLDLATNEIKEVRDLFALTPYRVAKTTYDTSHIPLDPVSRAFAWGEDNGAGQDEPSTNTRVFEEELGDIEDQIIGVGQELAEYRDIGDLESEIALAAELRELKERYAKLQETYAKSSH